MITVIRIIKYEAESEGRMRMQISNSMPEGIHVKDGMTISIATHFSDLPSDPVVTIDNEELHATLNKLEVKL